MKKLWVILFLVGEIVSAVASIFMMKADVAEQLAAKQEA